MDEAREQSGAELTQSEVAAARDDEGGRLQSEPATGGTPVPPDAPVPPDERAPEITPAGTLVLAGAESQAAAGEGGAVNELQELRVKVSTLQTSLDLVKTALENTTEQLHDLQERVEVVIDALYEENTPADPDAPAEQQTQELAAAVDGAVAPQVRKALICLAEQVEAVGGDRVVNRVKNTLDGCAAGGAQGGGAGG